MSTTPIAGCYAFEMVPNRVWNAVKIWHGAPRDPDTGELLDRSPRWQATRDAQPCDIEAVWPLRRNGKAISDADYDELLADNLARGPKMTTPGTSPGAGMYAIRVTKDGPLCALKVWYGPLAGAADKTPCWQAHLNGKPTKPERHVTIVGHVDDPIGTVSVRGGQIDEAEYRHMISVHEWAKKYEPSAPEANPYKPVDMNALPPIQFQRTAP